MEELQTQQTSLRLLDDSQTVSRQDKLLQVPLQMTLERGY